MEFVAFPIAIAVAYQALKAYRLSQERTMLYLHFSFVLLGAGLFIDGLSNMIVLLAKAQRGVLILSALGYTLNFIAQVLAYGILMVAYLKQTRNMTVLAATVLPAAFLFETNAMAELIILFLLVYIFAHTAINYSINKSTNALLVLGAFASLTVAHLFFMVFILIPVFFALAHIAQLFGFLLLLAMLLRVNQAG